MATVLHVTSSLGLRKFRANGFLFNRVYLSRWRLATAYLCQIWTSIQWCMTDNKSLHILVMFLTLWLTLKWLNPTPMAKWHVIQYLSTSTSLTSWTCSFGMVVQPTHNVRCHPNHNEWLSSPCSSSVWFSNMLPKTHSNQQSAPITVHISIYYKSYTDDIMTVLLHTGDDKKVTWLLYATLKSLMMGPWCPICVGVDILKHCCNSNELCAFVG